MLRIIGFGVCIRVSPILGNYHVRWAEPSGLGVDKNWESQHNSTISSELI